MTDDANKFQIRLIRGVLLLGTLLLYYPVVHHPFITYDDYYYLEVNPVRSGLTWSGVWWAMGTGRTGNWHPLTWLSHMLDCQIYGMNHPGGHHFTSLLFHLANTILMFDLWRRLTGAVWRSALVAALFAWHPLHVQSVAWVAERKDVLSAFFFLLALLAYTRFAEVSPRDRPQSKKWYCIMLVLYAFGLMAKPMIVTLPFVLLLLDFWPLRRISISKLQTQSDREAEAPLNPSLSPSEREGVAEGGVRGSPAGQLSLQKRLLEKIPFFVLSAASCAVTYLVQKHGGNMQATASLTFGDRVATALLGYAAYLGKAFWPVNLAIFYPFPPYLPRNEVVAAGLLLAAISAMATVPARRQPWLSTGWYWFLGMLVPVIGLVSVGAQAYADRYTYLSLTGIFVASIWSVHQLILPRAQHKIILGAGATAILLACALLTRREVNYWRSSLALFTRASEVTRDNPVVENNLGLAMDAAGKLAEAEKHYEASLKLMPDLADTWYLLGINLAAQSNYPAAVGCYQQKLRLGGNLAMVHYHYGNALAAMGDLTNAAAQYDLSVRLDPAFPAAHNNLGAIWLRLGRLEEAEAELETALRLQPEYPEAQDQLGHVLLKLGRPAQALPRFREAARLAPSLADAQFSLGLILAQQGSLQDALGPLQTAVKLEPGNAQAGFTVAAVYEALGQLDRAAENFSLALHLNPRNADTAARLGGVLAKSGKFGAATTAYRQALAIDANATDALQGLAWILATSPNAEWRDGPEAVRLARHAADLTGRKQPLILSALDAALAETGQFDEAIKTAQETAQLAKSQNQNEIAAQALARIELYKSGSPFRSPMP